MGRKRKKTKAGKTDAGASTSTDPQASTKKETKSIPKTQLKEEKHEEKEATTLGDKHQFKEVTQPLNTEVCAGPSTSSQTSTNIETKTLPKTQLKGKKHEEKEATTLGDKQKLKKVTQPLNTDVCAGPSTSSQTSTNIETKTLPKTQLKEEKHEVKEVIPDKKEDDAEETVAEKVNTQRAWEIRSKQMLDALEQIETKEASRRFNIL